MSSSNASSVEFFNDIVSDYDSLILKHVPVYADILWSMFYYLPQDFKPKAILELGCGTGNLTKAIRKVFPSSMILAVDAAKEMLEMAKEKIKDSNIEFVESTFQNLNFPKESFDLVMSNIAIHHLTDEEKKRLLQNLFKWQKPGSFFVYSDGIRNDNNERHKLDLKYWDELSLKNGVSEEDLQKIHEHWASSDFYPKTSDVITWLKEAGFTNIDIVYKYCIWGVIHSQKPY